MVLSGKSRLQGLNGLALLLLVQAFFSILAGFAVGQPAEGDKARKENPTAEWEETDLGTQITVVNVLSGIFGKDEKGSLVGYATLYGDPARLAIVDAETRSIRKTVDIPGDVKGLYAIEFASDGNVYLGGNPVGRVYRYRPGADSAEDLGVCRPGCKFIWDMVEGPAGKLYLATYPESRVVEYDIASGAFRDFGAMVEGEDYARCIAYDAGTGRVYVGVGAHAALIEFDPRTGEKKNILSDEYKDMHFVYWVNAVGGKLFGRMDPSSQGVVFDPKTGAVEAKMGNRDSVRMAPLSPDGKTVYYTSGGRLMAFDLAEKRVRSLDAEMKTNSNAFAFKGGADEPVLCLLGKGGWWSEYNVKTGKIWRGKIDYPRSPVGLQSMIEGPDGRVWTSGYLSGGVAVYDPKTGKSEEFTGVGQSEGMTTLGSRIYYGVYPRARIFVYDTKEPWDTGKKNPRELFSLEDEGQDRPFGMAASEEHNKLFIGTVPSYGLLGGALAIYDPTTEKLEVHRNLIPNQGIPSVVYADGKVIGGTTVSGGLGIKPSEKEGRIFVWDVAKGEKVYENVPVPGKIACLGLALGPDGNVWGWAEGTLFAFDPRTNKVVYSESKLPVDWSEGSHVWRAASMLNGGDGYLYGTLKEHFFRVDPKTKEFEVLRQGKMELIARDGEGALYYARADRLIRTTRPKKEAARPR